jgi:hypothetical protein
MLLKIVMISCICNFLIQACFAEDITCKPKTAQFPGTLSKYHDFNSYSFVVDNCNAIVVVPTKELPGKPWIFLMHFHRWI